MYDCEILNEPKHKNIFSIEGVVLGPTDRPVKRELKKIYIFAFSEKELINNMTELNEAGIGKAAAAAKEAAKARRLAAEDALNVIDSEAESVSSVEQLHIKVRPTGRLKYSGKLGEFSGHIDNAEGTYTLERYRINNKPVWAKKESNHPTYLYYRKIDRLDLEREDLGNWVIGYQENITAETDNYPNRKYIIGHEISKSPLKHSQYLPLNRICEWIFGRTDLEKEGKEPVKPVRVKITPKG